MNRAAKIIMCILIGVLYCNTARAAMVSDVCDSLRTLLSHTSDPHQRVDLLMSIIDIGSQGDDGSIDAAMLYKESGRIGDNMGLSTALATLAANMVGQPHLRDSVNNILNTTELLLRNTPYDGVTTYYQMVYKVRELAMTNNENRLKTCDSISTALTNRIASETKYQKCERFFVMAVIEYLLNSMSELPRTETIRSSLEKAWELAIQFPSTAKRYFSGNIYVMLSDTYIRNGNDSQLIAVSNEYLKILDDYYSDEIIKTRRPHIYKDDSYLLVYQSLMFNGQLIGEQKAKEYYDRFCKFMKDGKGDTILRNDFYFYQYSYQYFMSTGEYDKALESIDSVITIIEKQGSLNQEYALHYKNRAAALKAAGRLDEACDAYETTIHVSDSITNKQQLEEISSYLVDYEINELQLKKMQLSATNHMVALSFSGVIILILAGFSIYSHRNIKRTRRLQARLIEEAGKSQHSDMQKTKFINSICHEVRTPLNSINGFSELIAEGYATLDKRIEYAEIIESNCLQLKYLLNDLLHVTSLENRLELLPIGVVDVEAICRYQMEMAKRVGESQNKDIEYHIDLRLGKQEVYSNGKYLGIMLSAILTNAVKFTTRGFVSITAYTQACDGEIVIEVADSGGGIPKDKYDYVFERFTKIDPFSQGSGLGLYLCRLIISHLGGSITIDDNYNDGTKIIVRMPVNPYMQSTSE